MEKLPSPEQNYVSSKITQLGSTAATKDEEQGLGQHTLTLPLPQSYLGDSRLLVCFNPAMKDLSSGQGASSTPNRPDGTASTRKLLAGCGH